ncbi:MAG TPA: HDIG domain-containing protein [Spirochaetota bacterium]|nr:HDIG domain-containing protein [Spirochaetota bacterium]
MKYILDISKKNFGRFFKDKKIRFYYIFIGMLVMASTTILAYKITDKTYLYNIGDIADSDIRIQKDIYYVKDAETDVEKQRAVQSARLVFDKSSDVLEENLGYIDTIFDNVIETKEAYPALKSDDINLQLGELKARLPKSMHFSDHILLSFLSYDNPRELKKAVTRIIIYIYDYKGLGILDTEYSNPLNIENKNITIRNEGSSDINDEIPARLDDLVTADNVKSRLNSICYSVAPYLPADTLSSVVIVVRASLRPNLSFNADETSRRMDEKVKDVAPVKGLFKKGQTIVREGDTITTDVLQKINILNKYARTSHVNYIIGLILLQVIFLVILSFFGFNYESYYFPDKKAIVVIFSLIVFFMIYSLFAGSLDAAETSRISYILLLPIPFVTMMMTILYNIYLSFYVGLYVMFFSLMLVGVELQSVLLAFSTSVIGIFINMNVERRSDFFRGGLILGLLNAVIIIAISFIESTPWKISLTNVELALANGVLNSILVLGVFPLYEHFFDITTRFKLMELSDLNADIFKKMLLNAPGTYNHSLVVSTLAEAACKEIDANYMLARVGAYYHDIGKLVDSGMYIENGITDLRARRLSPTGYSKLIISHVSKGVQIAKDHGLPDSVIDFIREHHGKSTMTFFYHQALENATNNPTESVHKSDFQYPGPKPHSMETAVVMLADAIEAASRSIKEPTREKLEGMVRKIIYNKLNDGDLDGSGLSMLQLKKVQNVFLRMLFGIYHSRIEYPDAQKIRDLEKEVTDEKNGN